jgi:hypothetical protein
MLKASVGALVLVALVSHAQAQQQWGATAPGAYQPRAEAPSDPRRMTNGRETRMPNVVITEGHIARLRAVLRLSPGQQQLWAPVEVALSDLARQQARGEAAGFVIRMTDRNSAISATANHLQRIKAIAMPLIQSLDDTRKRDAIAFGRHMGLMQLVAAF